MFGGLWCHVVPVVIELFQFGAKWIVSGAVLVKKKKLYYGGGRIRGKLEINKC